MAKNKKTAKKAPSKKLTERLRSIFVNKVAGKTYGLIALVLFFVITANVLASSDSFYKLGSNGRDDYVLFSFSKESVFTAQSKNLKSYQPSYIYDKDFKQILDIRKAVKGISIWDSKLFYRLMRALKKSPAYRWVESVQSVERVFPASVRINLKLRKPFAIVDMNGRLFYVDRNKKLLPVDKKNVKLKLVKIHGINTEPPEYGQEWKGDYISDAIGLMRLLTGLVKGDKLLSILEVTSDLTCEPAYENIPDFTKPRITLKVYDCELVWDIFSKEKLADGKAVNATKVRNLLELFLNGRIEDIKDVKRIDLTSPDSIVTYKGKR